MDCAPNDVLAGWDCPKIFEAGVAALDCPPNANGLLAGLDCSPKRVLPD